jgi:DNA-binding FrmR family transcriptional regulator
MAKNHQSHEVSQLHRIYGQIQGIENMLENGVAENKIIQQIEAAKGSLKTLEKKILSRKIKEFHDEETKKTLNYLIKIS